MHSLSTADVTTDLVRLRRWAMAQLRRQHISGEQSEWLQGVSDESWSMFLILERCASPLLAAILETGHARGLPASALKLLRAEAAKETECVLRAERDSRWLAAFARETGVKPVALKGLLPAMAAAAPPLHLFDLDILASESDEKLIGEFLANAGFKAATDNEVHHIYWSPPVGHLPLELHQTVFSTGAPLPREAWDRTTAVSNMPGMYRLAYADQMHHMLHHSIVQHTDRHIRIRDLLLMSWILSQMDENDHRQLDGLIDGLPTATAFRNLMQFAESFGDDAERRNDDTADPYEDDAILFFAANLLARDSAIWSGGPPLAWQGAAAVAAGRNSVTDLTRFASKNPVTGIKAFSNLQRKTPAAGQAITRVGRAALYFTSATFGSPVLLAIRREVTRRLKAPLSSR
jgi:hypothetical protein